jgi:hypothetical protein
MGVAKGIHPGRVVWVHDENATSWDGSTGNWWDDKNTDPKAVDMMVSSTLKGLTGQADDAQAWDALFRHFNKTHGFGDAGYQKPGRSLSRSMNQERGGDWKPEQGMPSPRVVYSVVPAYQSGGVPARPSRSMTSRDVSDPIIRGSTVMPTRVPESRVRGVAQERQGWTHRCRAGYRQAPQDQGRHRLFPDVSDRGQVPD